VDREQPPRRSGFNQRQLRRSDPFGSRPDRIAMWAVFLAVAALLLAAATGRAAGASGGISTEAGTGCADARLGERELSLGDCGTDVLTLNWILNSKEFGLAAGLGQDFDGGTERAVSSLQRVAELAASGVVDEETRGALVASMRRDVATWYGPGFYGNELACGGRLTRRTVGVAHKTLPCGTKVVIRHRGRFLRTKVIDRGPFVDGVHWDLTSAAASRVGMTATARVRSAIVRP
jgi:hypothetical protein